MKGQHYAVMYRHPDGREEVRYRRPIADLGLAWAVASLRRWCRRHSCECRYRLQRCGSSM
jgi:hypothetical protein